MINLPQQVAQNIDRFTGRTWLLPNVLGWWERTNERLFLLAGDAGTGKSMITAWLTGYGPPPEDPAAEAQLARVRSSVRAVHFCQATSRNITPLAFAESIANQLTERVTGFADAVKATLADRVQISAIATAGTVATGGANTGLIINRIDLSSLGEEFSFDRAFILPLKKLYESGHGESMLLLIDALDEAQTYTGVTLPDLLSRLADLPARVRILATTRNEPRVLKFFRGTTPFDLIRDAASDVDDVRSYAAQRLTKLATVSDSKRDEFAKRLSKQAKGVFLYAAMVLDDILGRPIADLPDLEIFSLPHGLSGLYHDFMNRELGKDERRWFDLYEPLLGLIGVAQGEGLSAAQLTAIIGTDVRAALRSTKQYLVGDLPEGPFSPFHKSFGDFLLEDADNIDYHIDAPKMHCRIAEHYWAKHHNDWSKCDDYGLRNVIYHTLSADFDDRCERIARICDAGFLAARHERESPAHGIIEDFRRCVSHARKARDVRHLLLFSLCLSLWQELAAQKSDPGYAIVLAALGRVTEALDLAWSADAGGPVPKYERDQKRREFARGLAELGLIEAALSFVDRIPKEEHPESVLLAVLEGFALSEASSDGGQLLERVSALNFSGGPWATPEVCRALARSPSTTELARRLAGESSAHIIAVYEGMARHDLQRAWEASKFVQPLLQDIGGERPSIGCHIVRLRLLSEHATDIERAQRGLELAETQLGQHWDYAHGIVFAGRLAAIDATLGRRAAAHLDTKRSPLAIALIALHVGAAGAIDLCDELIDKLPEDLLGSKDRGLEVMLAGAELSSICVALALIDIQPPTSPALQRLLERFAAAMIEVLPKHPDCPEFVEVGGPILGRMFAIAGDSFIREFARVAAANWSNKGGMDASREGVIAGLALRRGASFVATTGADLYPASSSHAGTLAATQILARRDPDAALALFRAIPKRYYATRSSVAGVIARGMAPRYRSRLASLLTPDDFLESAVFVDAIADARRGLTAPDASLRSRSPTLIEAMEGFEAGGVAKLQARAALNQIPEWTEVRWRGAPIRHEDLRKLVLSDLAAKDFRDALKIARENANDSLATLLGNLRTSVRAWLDVHGHDVGAIPLWDELLMISGLQSGEPLSELLNVAIALELVAWDRDGVMDRLKGHPDLIAPVKLLGGVEPCHEQGDAVSFGGELLLGAGQGLLVHELGKRDPSAALQRILSLAKSDVDSLMKILFNVWPLPTAESVFAALTQIEAFVATHYSDYPFEQRAVTNSARRRFALRLAHWAPRDAVAVVRGHEDPDSRESLLKDVIEAAMASLSDKNPDWVWWSEVADTITDEGKRADAFGALLAEAKRTEASAAIAMSGLIGQLSTGPRRSFMLRIRDVAELAAVAAPAEVPHMLDDLEGISAWFSGQAASRASIRAT